MALFCLYNALSTWKFTLQAAVSGVGLILPLVDPTALRNAGMSLSPRCLPQPHSLTRTLCSVAQILADLQAISQDTALSLVPHHGPGLIQGLLCSQVLLFPSSSPRITASLQPVHLPALQVCLSVAHVRLCLFPSKALKCSVVMINFMPRAFNEPGIVVHF